MYDVESEIVHQIPHAHGHDNRLICSHAPQSAPVEMIEVSVSYEYEIYRGQMMNFEAWLLQSLDHLEPFRPDRVDQDVDFVGLH